MATFLFHHEGAKARRSDEVLKGRRQEEWETVAAVLWEC